MRKLGCFALLVVLFLSGCATSNAPSGMSSFQNKPWHQRRSHLTKQESWNIQGGVSIQNRGKTFMGSFSWKQMHERYAMNISGPLNLGGIRIQGDARSVTLYKSGGVFSAQTPEALMQQQLGWYLPLSNLYYWVRGLPAPGAITTQQQDEYGHLALLQQQGWSIRYGVYQSYSQDHPCDLPHQIIMDNQQLHVKLVINYWNFRD